MEKTTVDLIRHGEPEGGIRFRGWRDDPLSETGFRQMGEAVGEKRPWDRIITSPLARCANFSQALSRERDIPLAVDERLKEIGFGAWEGRVLEELYREDPQAMADFWRDPIVYPPPEAERMELFQDRVYGAWEALQEDYRGEHLLVVAHGGVNRMIIGSVLGMPLTHLFRMEIPYAGISRICIEDEVPRLVFHGGVL